MEISKEDLFQILYLSEKGFPEVLKTKSKTGTHYDKLLKECQDLSFDAALDFVLKHTELLRTPLVFDYHNLMIGFNEEEIRKFLPRIYRNLKMKRNGTML